MSNHATRGTAQVTIVDDDAPTVSVQGGVSIIEGEAPAWIFHSSFPVGQDMTIGFETEVSGSTNSGTVTLPAGQTRMTYRHTATTDDSVRADPPDITLNLQRRLTPQGGGYKVGEPSSATVEVHDNDDRRAVATYPTKRLTIAAQYSLAEGNPNADRDVDRIRTFVVRSTQWLGRTVVFEVCFSGTATQETGDTWSGNSDYQILKGGIVQTGNCVKDVISGRGPSDNIAIRVRADNRGENDETVIATVSTTHPGVKIGYTTTTGYTEVTYTIFDDDKVEVWQTAIQVDVLEGDTAEVELCQSRRRSVVTKIELNIADVGATAGSDYLLGGGRDRIVTIPPGHLCAITTFQTISDGLDEVSEFFNVGLPNSGHSQGVTRAARDDANRRFSRASVVIQDPLNITMSSNRESKLNPDDRSATALRVGRVSEGGSIRLDFTADRAAPWDIPISYSLSGSPYDAGYQITPAKGQRQVILKKGRTKASVTMSVANDSIRQDTSKDCCVRIELLSQPRYRPTTDKEIYWVDVVGDLSDSGSPGGGIGVGDDDDSPQPAVEDGIGVGDDDDGPQPAVEDGTADLPASVAHWRFDGDALDHSGSSHGTTAGGAAFAANEDGSGVGTHALVLDGSDDHVDLSSHVSNFPLGDAARTVAGWFKADAGSQGQTFLAYGPNAAGQRFSIAADRTQALVAVSGHARGVNGLDLDDGWHHVAVTYAGGDSDGISIYLDGVLQAASTLVGAPQSVDTQPGSPGSSPAAIGRSVSGAAHYAGSIDDVRIYDAALRAEQVLALFNEHPQALPPVTTAVTASASPSLAEGNLDGADVELTVDAGAFAATVGTSDVTASGVSGLSVSSVTRDGDGRATATLAFDGTDFDADATLTLTVSAGALAHSDAALSATLPVAAVDEPPPPPAVSIPAPVAHWSFDGDVGDSAGSSNGSARNGASFTTAASVGSHALSLDGSDDHVDLAPHVSKFPLGNSARSVTGWFRADAGGQGQTFFVYGPNVEGKRLSIAADRTQALVAVSGHAWGVNGLSLADGWHHVAVTFPGGNSDDFSIYLDGALQSASTLGGVRRQVDTRSGGAAIGRSVSGAAHYGGDIDDVRLYDYALSAEQVQAIATRNESAQATAAMPGGLLPAPLALPRTNVGADGTGAGGFGASPVNGTGSSFALESEGALESDEAHNRSIPPSGRRAPSLATTASATTATGRTHAPLVPSASNPMREGLVRIVNPSAQTVEVRIVAIDDAGWRGAPVTLGIGAGASAQFTARDLEWGNAALGLFGAAGPGTGDWRLEVSSGLDVEVLPYARTADGTLSAMGDVVATEDNVHRVALFNPADSPDAASKLRLTNRGAQALRANITGIDDTGASPGGMVSVEIAADESVLLTAAELETGGANLLGALGDGEGQWRLDIASDGDLAVMNLAETSDGNLTNLSNATATSVPARKAHVVDRFPSSSDISNEQGVVRIVNSTGSPTSVRIEPNDSTGWRYPPLTLTLGANEAANLGTWDLELGNASKGLAGNAGPGTGGAWRLEISSDGDIEVLTYARAPNGLLKVPPGDAAAEDKRR